MMEPKIEITNLITPLLNTFKLLNDEWKHLLEIGISEYLHSQTEKYYFTNTFLHRSEKVRFDDIYFPIKSNYKKLNTDFSNLDDIFENYKNITLIGSAGSGKTTLIKYIFLNSIRKSKKIPILIELRFLNQYDGNFEKLISEKILKSKIKPSDDTFKRTLESGSFIFLLDGYDEIFTDKKQELNRQIESFVDSYSQNNFFITTRPGSGIENFPRFYDFRVLSLNDDDVKGFINKIVVSEERKNRILDIISDPKNNTYIEYLRNPLLLSMFILAFESHPEIPSRKSSFYRNVFDTLYSKHDGITKNSFPREKLTKFEREDFERILNIFSYLTLIQGKYSFTEELLTDNLNKVLKSMNLVCKTENLIYDLQTTISILILDGFEYYFPHRSMQEYFTAQFISNLPSEKKQKAFDNIIEIIDESSPDSNYHLWDLCSELDRHSFLSHFLIPQLKLIEETLSNKNDYDMLNAFIEIAEPSIFSNNFENPNVFKDQLIIYRMHNFHSCLVDFCLAYDYDLFASFIENSTVKSDFLKHLELNSISGFDGIEIDEPVKEIFLKHKIANILKGFKKSVSSKIKQYQKEIDSDKKSLDKLLNL